MKFDQGKIRVLTIKTIRVHLGTQSFTKISVKTQLFQDGLWILGTLRGMMKPTIL